MFFFPHLDYFRYMLLKVFAQSGGFPITKPGAALFTYDVIDSMGFCEYVSMTTNKKTKALEPWDADGINAYTLLSSVSCSIRFSNTTLFSRMLSNGIALR